MEIDFKEETEKSKAVQEYLDMEDACMAKTGKEWKETVKSLS